MLARIFELVDDAEPSVRHLDLPDRPITSLLVVAPRSELSPRLRRLDTLNDGVIAVNVSIQTAHLAVGDDVYPCSLHVAYSGVRGIVQHLLHVERP